MAIIDDCIFLLGFYVYKKRLLNNGLCGLVVNGFDPWFKFMNICLVSLFIGLIYEEATVAHPLYGFFGLFGFHP